MSKLTKSWPYDKEPQFDSSRLHIGEMMVCDDSISKGEVLLRCYCSIVSLTDPTHTWKFNFTSECPKLIGRKLLPGESITLTQE